MLRVTPCKTWNKIDFVFQRKSHFRKNVDECTVNVNLNNYTN